MAGTNYRTRHFVTIYKTTQLSLQAAECVVERGGAIPVLRLLERCALLEVNAEFAEFGCCSLQFVKDACDGLLVKSSLRYTMQTRKIEFVRLVGQLFI
jgi:hypothetical protein